MPEDVLQLLTGPFGGLIAVGIGIGFMTGYNFAQRTVFKMSLERLEEVRRQSEYWREEAERWERHCVQVLREVAELKSQLS